MLIRSLSLAGGIFSLPPFLSAEARSLLSRMLTVDSNKRIKLHEIRQLPWFQKDLPKYLFPPLGGPPRVDTDEWRSVGGGTEGKPEFEHVEHGQAAAPTGGAAAGGRRDLGGDNEGEGSVSGGEEPKTPTGTETPSLARGLGPLTPREEKTPDEASIRSALSSLDPTGANNGSSHQPTAADPTPPQEGRRREWVEGLGVVDQEIVDDLCDKIKELRSEDVWKKLKEGGDKELRIAYQLCRDNKRMMEGCEFGCQSSSSVVELGSFQSIRS